ncbi:MAG: AraC family transcriptional regulator ligand-binding domain-containing protein [Pseudomonadales bacterium]|nr:AraC family transcriptional regulator ligand-binding domain-containing protein [Pseudomonadales bacterium]
MPTSYAIVLYRDALARGHDLLDGLPVSTTDLETAEYMPIEHYFEVLKRYTALQDDPEWGFRLGQQFSMSAHGPVGFGATSAPTIRDGLLFLSRYLPVRTPYARATIEQRGYSLVLRIHHDAELAPFLVRSCETLAAIFQSYIEGAGASAQPLVWRFPYDRPAHEALYTRWIHGGVYFGHDCLQIEVPHSVGMIPSAFRNDAAYRSTMAQCEALLTELSDDTVEAKVRGIMASHIERRMMESVPLTEVPTADDIARQFGISRRTLIRQLKGAGTTFQQIRDALLKTYLESLLRESALPLGDVAYRLGYADAANLTRACRRLFGRSPTELRRTLSERS